MRSYTYMYVYLCLIQVLIHELFSSFQGKILYMIKFKDT